MTAPAADGELPAAGSVRRGFGLLVPPRGQASGPGDLPDDYRSLVEAVAAVAAETGGAVTCVQAAARAGLDVSGRPSENVRAKLKRLEDRGWLRRTAAGTFTVAGGAQARSARFQMIMSNSGCMGFRCGADLQGAGAGLISRRSPAKPGLGVPAGSPDQAWRPGLLRVSAALQRRFRQLRSVRSNGRTGFSNLKNWRILTRLRMNPARPPRKSLRGDRPISASVPAGGPAQRR
jgi:hypothetical protein